MNTRFIEVYKVFKRMIDDYELDLITDEELAEVLKVYLDRSRGMEFKTCTKDIQSAVLLNEKAVEEGLASGVPVVEDWSFTVELGLDEIHILALGMVKAWVSPKLRNVDLMRKDYGDRDYKAVQGEGYLNVLDKINDKTDTEMRRAVIEYSYKDM